MNKAVSNGKDPRILNYSFPEVMFCKDHAYGVFQKPSDFNRLAAPHKHPLGLPRRD
jgi:hypothetical protein